MAPRENKSAENERKQLEKRKTRNNNIRRNWAREFVAEAMSDRPAFLHDPEVVNHLDTGLVDDVALTGKALKNAANKSGKSIANQKGPASSEPNDIHFKVAHKILTLMEKQVAKQGKSPKWTPTQSQVLCDIWVECHFNKLLVEDAAIEIKSRNYSHAEMKKFLNTPEAEFLGSTTDLSGDATRPSSSS